MSDGTIMILFVLFIAALVIVVGFVGNRIVDRGADALRNRSVRKRNAENAEKPEEFKRLAERFEKGRKL